MDRSVLISEYARQFRTQGNRQGKYWFLGIEEGGGASVNEVLGTLETWQRSGKPDESVLRDPKNPAHDNGWFKSAGEGVVPIQTTWGAQIRVLLAMKGLPASTEDVRRYQYNHFGHKNGESCLMELLPLPNPSTRDWIYSELSDDPQFASRDAYSNYLIHDRLEQFKSMVLQYQPQNVVAMCYAYRAMLLPHLEKVQTITQNGNMKRPGKAKIGYLGATHIAITYHPSYFMTARNDWYAELGQMIAGQSDPIGNHAA